MKKILQASLSAVLVLSLVGCGSTKDEAIYQDSIDAYVNEIDMDYAYDFTKHCLQILHYMIIHLDLERVVPMQNIEQPIIWLRK